MGNVELENAGLKTPAPTGDLKVVGIDYQGHTPGVISTDGKTFPDFESLKAHLADLGLTMGPPTRFPEDPPNQVQVPFTDLGKQKGIFDVQAQHPFDGEPTGEETPSLQSPQPKEIRQ